MTTYTITIFACLALMTLIFRARCMVPGRILINPFFGLLVGCAYYVILPCIVIIYFQDDISGLTAYSGYLSPPNALWVLQYTAALLGSMWLGQWIASGPHPILRHPRRRRPEGPAVRRYPMPGRTQAMFAKWIVILSFLAMLALAVTIRQFLFVGYDETALASDAVWSARGAMSSFYSLIYLGIAAVVLLRRKPIGKLGTIYYTAIFAMSSLILLSLGARLYVAMGAITLLALLSHQQRGIPLGRLAIYLGSTVAAFGLVGVLRSSEFGGLGSVMLNVALEPLLTSISMFTLITDNPLILFGKPWLFLFDFQAILPSFLFPGKGGLFGRLADYGYAFEAPIGGYHLYLSALMNFGTVGFLLLTGWCGHALGRMCNLGRVTTSASVLTSVFLTGALTFTVYRDPFFVSIAKNVALMGIVMPWVITTIRLYSRPSSRSPRLTEAAHAG
jgi:hypothetical protein